MGLAERRCDHDAVRVRARRHSTVPRNCTVHLNVEVPSHALRYRHHGVDRSAPLGDLQPSFFGHLPGETGDRVLTHLHDSTRRGPVGQTVAAKVLDQQNSPIKLDNPSGHSPSTKFDSHAAMFARLRYVVRNPRRDGRVFDKGSGAETLPVRRGTNDGRR